MFITFTGNPMDRADRRDLVSIGGIDFPLNIAVEVKETPIFTKLRRNGHFSVRDDKPAPTPAPKQPAEVTTVSPPAPAKPDITATDRTIRRRNR